MLSPSSCNHGTKSRALPSFGGRYHLVHSAGLGWRLWRARIRQSRLLFSLLLSQVRSLPPSLPHVLGCNDTQTRFLVAAGTPRLLWGTAGGRHGRHGTLG